MLNFVPKQGELIIYEADNVISYPRIKIGDGVTKVSALPFLGEGQFVQSVSGKGLSTNDYTAVDKERVSQLTDSYINSLIDSYFAAIPIAENTKF